MNSSIKKRKCQDSDCCLVDTGYEYKETNNSLQRQENDVTFNEDTSIIRKASISWELQFLNLVKFVADNGHAQVPPDLNGNNTLLRWVLEQRQEYHLMKQGLQSQLTEDKVQLLTSVGFVFDESKGGTNKGEILTPEIATAVAHGILEGLQQTLENRVQQESAATSTSVPPRKRAKVDYIKVKGNQKTNNNNLRLETPYWTEKAASMKFQEEIERSKTFISPAVVDRNGLVSNIIPIQPLCPADLNRLSLDDRLLIGCHSHPNRRQQHEIQLREMLSNIIPCSLTPATCIDASLNNAYNPSGVVSSLYEPQGMGLRSLFSQRIYQSSSSLASLRPIRSATSPSVRKEMEMAGVIQLLAKAMTSERCSC